MTSPICRVCGNIEEYEHHDPVDKCSLAHPFDPMPERNGSLIKSSDIPDTVVEAITDRTIIMAQKDEIREKDAEIKDLKERLEKVRTFSKVYAWHSRDCAFELYDDEDCPCGYRRNFDALGLDK